MYLEEISTIKLSKRQFLYKLRSSGSMFYYFIVMQVIALLITGGSMSMTGMGLNNVYLSVRGYSGEMIIAFSMLWIFVMSIQITTKAYRNVDFTVVSNRFSSNLSNIALLYAGSLFGGVTATLTGVALRVITYFIKGSHAIIVNNFILSPQEILAGILATTLYLVLISSVGYLIGLLVQFHRSFIALMPMLLFFTLRYSIQQDGKKNHPILFDFIGIIINEHSLITFVIKAIVISTLLFGAGTLLSNRMEVRR